MHNLKSHVIIIHNSAAKILNLIIDLGSLVPLEFVQGTSGHTTGRGPTPNLWKWSGATRAFVEAEGTPLSQGGDGIKPSR